MGRGMNGKMKTSVTKYLSNGFHFKLLPEKYRKKNKFSKTKTLAPIALVRNCTIRGKHHQ
jgi:hypothetical protein